jgi:NAD+ synthase (glutamine-hydrolysing)
MEKAEDQRVDLLSFPELALTGYPPEDLLLKPQFIERNRYFLDRLVGESANFAPTVIGFVDSDSENIYNAAALIGRGNLLRVFHKQILPNYGVFDEKRYFSQGENNQIFTMNSHPIAINICEDIWDDEGPYTNMVFSGGVELLLVINASPFHAGKWKERYDMLSRRSRENRVIIAYINQVGGQDELVFDGHSLLFGPQGELLGQAKQFEEDFVVLDIDFEPVHTLRQKATFQAKKLEDGCFDRIVVHIPKSKRQKYSPTQVIPTPTILEPREEIYKALLLGTCDYVQKNGFKKVLIGLSGGIDSALVAVIASDALGPQKVETVFMPSDYSSPDSEKDARMLAANLGLSFRVIPIQPVFKIFLKTLNPYFDDLPPNVAEENLQARIRGNILMALSNKFGWLVLTTGNKSEVSVGYATLYGDMAGGFAVIKDIYKELVYELSVYRNHIGNKPVIPDRILTKEPSAELSPGQRDSDSLPPYPELDPILKLYVEEDKSLEDIAGAGFDHLITQRVLRMVDRNEYKRRQAPPGIRITPKAFGKDRRIPITNHFRSVP